MRVVRKLEMTPADAEKIESILNLFTPIAEDLEMTQGELLDYIVDFAVNPMGEFENYEIDI